MVKRAMQIDLPPKNHSHLYELRPMSPWLFVPAVGALSLFIWLNGVDRMETWGLVLFGGMFFSLIPMVFPRQLLSRPKDAP
jgi:hypothetical protein